MACRECSSFCVKDGLRASTVMISLPVRELVTTMVNILKAADIPIEVKERTVVIDTDDPDELLRNLSFDHSLTNFQLQSINVLVIDADSELTFDRFRDVKTLFQYRSTASSADIAECLGSRRIESHFQPILDLATNRIHGFEALARGLRPDMSIIPPIDLFRFADETESVFFLDRLTRETAIRSASELHLEGKIFINFMPNAIYDPTQCLKTTFAVAEEMHIDPSRIVFEVIETERVGDMDHLSYIFDYYRHHGFLVALDDIGSGYSGLNTLIDLKPDIIKIDREIVAGIDSNSMKQAIFTGLTAAANSHGITVVAEGIETKEELDFVSEHGASLAQGYYIARPSKNPPRKLAPEPIR